MNPLTWSDGWFLVFYGVFCLSLLFAARKLRQRLELGGEPTPVLTDPYLIAHLRAGKNEALRVGVVSLLDRKLLRRTGTEDLVVDSPLARDTVRRPMERALLAHFAAQRAATSIFNDPTLTDSTRGFVDELARQRLVVDAKTTARRFAVTLPFFAAAMGVGVARLLQAAGAGRHNVAYLIGIMVFTAVLFVAGCTWRPRSYRGDAALSDLRSLFTPLKQRAAWLERGGRTSEVVFTAAVFGLSFLPGELAFARELYWQSTPKGSDVVTGYPGNGGSSCGSTCGSSCGGGGCGGGCGGCGS